MGACLYKLCAIGCSQVVYTERNDAKSLMKSTDLILKLEIMFKRVSEETRVNRRGWGKLEL